MVDVITDPGLLTHAERMALLRVGEHLGTLIIDHEAAADPTSWAHRPIEPLTPEPPTEGTIQARFEAFHALNPWVYRAFVELARDYQGRGYPRIGIGHLTEILRWQRRMKTYDPASDFKLSNDYRSRYARLIMAQEHDLEGFITTRMLRSE